MQSFEALSCNQKDKQKKMKNLSRDALVKNGGGFIKLISEEAKTDSSSWLFIANSQPWVTNKEEI